MKQPLDAFLGQLKGASLAAKLALACGVLALAGVVAVATQWADKPNFVLLASNLDARTSAAVQSALATAGVRYQASQPPGPFVVHVDEEQYYMAQNAIALGGALDTPPSGIRTDQSGASSVFLSASERAQSALKREWQEMESQLEALDFVERARVSTSTPDRSPLRRDKSMTVAVTLTLRGHGDLSRGQAATVAKLVRHRFNVPSESVMISDQSGRALWDAVKQDEGHMAASDLLDHQGRHDEDLQAKANAVLEEVFGPGLARVVVASQWSFEELESVKETVDPKNKVVVSETNTKTSTPQEGGMMQGPPAPGTEPAPVAMAETSETQKSTVVGRETSLRRVTAPKLERLSVSLFLDESQKDSSAGLEAAVKSAVGFDEKRGDSYSSFVSPFAGVKRDEAGKPVPPAPLEPLEEPSPMTEMLVERAVEIVAALVFLFVMFKALKGVSKPGVDVKADTAREDDEMLELLARGSVEELIKNEPERVGAVLSRWAAEGKETAAKGAAKVGAR
jgi:flagellar M-ring protein FliF